MRLLSCAHGTAARGDRHGMTRISDAEVAEIRRLAGSVTYAELGLRFGLKASSVGRIVRRERR